MGKNNLNFFLYVILDLFNICFFFTFSTREYRAPESILQLRYHFTLDVWAVGCTIFDLWKGFTLFEGVRGNNVSHLLRMEIILHGPLPQRFLDASPSDFIRDRESFYSNGYCDLKTSSNRFSYFQSHPTRLLVRKI